MNNGRWTPEEEEYIRKNAGKATLAEMAEHVSRSELAVQLFMHRRKIVVRQVVKRNLVQEILRMKFKHPETFIRPLALIRCVFGIYTTGVNLSLKKNIFRSAITSGLLSRKPSRRVS